MGGVQVTNDAASQREIASSASLYPPPLTRQPSEFRSCVKVEVAILGSPSLISLKVKVQGF